MAHVVDKFKLSPVEGYKTQMPYGHLLELARDIPQHESENAIFDIRNCEDVGVYKVNDNTAVVSVMDYLTAYMDEPFDFGRIVAANSFSYVYALGATPTHALNMLCFPACLDISVAGKMMAGSAEKCMEANCSVAGGHSILDENPKYGLNINAIVHPDKLLSYSKAKPGDKIIVTKKQGTGLINTALSLKEVSTEDIQEAVDSMVILDKQAIEAALELGVHASTNINNYGLFARLTSMASGSGLTARVDSRSIPVIALAASLTEDGWNSPGNQKNREFCGERLQLAEGADEVRSSLGFDPQVSGGLLLSMPAENCEAFMERLTASGYCAAVIGSFEEYDGKAHVYVE